MKFLNYTPHPLNIITCSGNTIHMPVDGPAPRLETKVEHLDNIILDENDCIEFFKLKRKKFLRPIGMPNPKPNVIFIVSSLVANHPTNADRADLVSPGELIRDDNGNVIGCDGLTAGVGLAIEDRKSFS